VQTGTWRIEEQAMRFLRPMKMSTNLTWNDLVDRLGYTTWEDLGNLRWTDLIKESSELMFSNTDGHLYRKGTEGDNTAALDGYRIEPILGSDILTGDPYQKTLLQELWFDFSEYGDFVIHTYYRGGDTVGEVNAASWTEMPTLSMNKPSTPVVYLSNSTNTNNYYHQIKWGTDGVNEPFVVPAITFKFERGAIY